CSQQNDTDHQQRSRHRSPNEWFGNAHEGSACLRLAPQFRLSETLTLLFLATGRRMNGSEMLTAFLTSPFSAPAVGPGQAVLASVVAALSVQRASPAAIYTGHLRRLVRRAASLHQPTRDFLQFGQL